MLNQLHGSNDQCPGARSRKNDCFQRFVDEIHSIYRQDFYSPPRKLTAKRPEDHPEVKRNIIVPPNLYFVCFAQYVRFPGGVWECFTIYRWMILFPLTLLTLIVISYSKPFSDLEVKMSHGYFLSLRLLRSYFLQEVFQHMYAMDSSFGRPKYIPLRPAERSWGVLMIFP